MIKLKIKIEERFRKDCSANVIRISIILFLHTYLYGSKNTYVKVKDNANNFN